MKNLLYILVVGVVVFLATKRCTPPKIITKTEYVTKTDTIHSTSIVKEPVIRYVRRTITEQGKDSIIFVEKASKNEDSTLTANEYDAVVKTDSSRADLKILTTGELLDVKGTITYTQKNTHVTEFRNASGLFLTVQSDVLNLQEFGVGLDYVFKNSVMIGASVNYDRLVKQPNIKAKIGIKIF